MKAARRMFMIVVDGWEPEKWDFLAGLGWSLTNLFKCDWFVGISEDFVENVN